MELAQRIPSIFIILAALTGAVSASMVWAADDATVSAAAEQTATPSISTTSAISTSSAISTNSAISTIATTSTAAPSSTAAEPTESSTTTSAAKPHRSAAGEFSSGALVQLVLGLGLVIGLILVLAWLVKRMGYMTGLTHSGLKVVATLPLSARERLVVVQAGEQQLLLGVAPGRVNLLKTFDEPVLEGPVTPQFALKLKEALNKSRDRSSA